MSKKILIQCSMFIPDLKEKFNETLETINKSKYNVYSPITFVKEHNYIQLIAAAISLKNFNPSEINNKPSIYVGPALSSTKFDYIISIDKEVVEAQEIYVTTQILPRMKNEYTFHQSSESNLFFKAIKEAVDYLNETDIFI